MKIFMDTANVEEIAKFVDWGVVYGVTTNQSLIAKSGRTQAEVIPEIAKLVAGPVSAEVISTECDGMVEEARKLVKIADNIVIKIPCIPEGLKAVKILSAEGIKTNVTLVFTDIIQTADKRADIAGTCACGQQSLSHAEYQRYIGFNAFSA